MIEKYIITSAVNNSKVFDRGLQTLEVYAEHQNATLLILPIKYNPARLSQDEIVYDDRVEIYIQRGDFTLNGKMSVLPEINISPTAIRPLQGLASLGHESHTLVASPRLHLDTIPTMDRYHPKFILTTGCITEENYTISKLGAKANFHHTYGAVIVEIDTDKDYIHFRQVSLDDNGVMNDIDTRYSPEGVNKAKTDAIVFGDIHEMFLADVVKDKGLFGDESLVRICEPEFVVYHDLLDQYTESHHNQNSPFRKYMIANEGVTIVEEVKSAVNFVDRTIKELGVTPIIVSSNHNSHLTQWLERTDWKYHPKIARDVLNYTLMMLDEIDATDNVDAKIPDIFRLILLKEFGDSIIALDYNENMKLNTFEIALHGDKGVNGARTLGNIHNHINTKLVSAHSHSAKRIDGHSVVGTSSELDRNYTHGLSTWSHTHALIHDNNKLQLITQNSLNGEFRIKKSADSRMGTFKLLDKRDFEPHFTQNMNDILALEEGMKYKITKDDGEVFYAKSYRHIRELSNDTLSERFCRALIQDGEKNEWICVNLQ